MRWETKLPNERKIHEWEIITTFQKPATGNQPKQQEAVLPLQARPRGPAGLAGLLRSSGLARRAGPARTRGPRGRLQLPDADDGRRETRHRGAQSQGRGGRGDDKVRDEEREREKGEREREEEINEQTESKQGRLGKCLITCLVFNKRFNRIENASRIICK